MATSEWPRHSSAREHTPTGHLPRCFWAEALPPGAVRAIVWLLSKQPFLERQRQLVHHVLPTPWNAAALGVMRLLSVTTAVPNKAPLHGSLAALLATESSWRCQQHHLAAADSSRSSLNARGGSWSPLLVCKSGCVEGQWRHPLCARPLAPGEEKEKPNLGAG